MAIGRARTKLEWSSEANQPPVSSLALAGRPTTRQLENVIVRSVQTLPSIERFTTTQTVRREGST